HDLTGAGDIDIGGIQFAQGNAGEVLAGGGPAVIDLHHAVDIEAGCDLAWPVGTELTGDQLIELVVGLGLLEGGLCGGIQTQLGEDGACGGGQDTGPAGDLLGEFTECRGVHDSPGCATCGRQGDGNAEAGSDGCHGGVDKRIKLSGTRRCGGRQG